MITLWEEKAWGKTATLISSLVFSKHKLQVIAGGYCSLHYHHKRSNRFIIDSAQIRIILFRDLRVHKYDLGPGDVFDVPAMVPHLFCVYGSGDFYEEYYPERTASIKTSDIIRLCEGGWMEVSLLDNLPKGLPAHSG